MKEVFYRPAAQKSLLRHANMAPRILQAMSEYAAGDGARANQVKALRGAELLRLRVGDFRVLFSETDRAIVVLDIGPRGNIYD